MTTHVLRMIFAGLVPTMVLFAQTRTVPISDPVLQMSAWNLTNVPSGWQVDGTMLPGSSCGSGTSPVVRAMSPDGQAGSYMLPRGDWAWGAGVRSGQDCLPFHEVLSAKDYLTYLVRIRELGFVREEPVPELAQAQRSMEAMNQQSRGTAHYSIDMARYLVRYSVNGKPYEEWLTGTVSCHEGMVMGVGKQSGCSAFTTRWFAPLGRLAQLTPQFEAMKMVLNQAWMDQWTAVMVRNMQARTKRQTEALLEQGRLAQAQRMKQHQDFMASQEQGRELRTLRFQEGQYRKTEQKEDYVDYILDCQRLYGRNTRVSVGNCPTRETY